MATATQDCHKTVSATLKVKYPFKILPLGFANGLWVFQRAMSLAFTDFGERSGLLIYIDDVIVCSAT